MERSRRTSSVKLTPTASLVLQEDTDEHTGGWNAPQDGRRLQSKTFNMLNDLIESGKDVSSMYASLERPSLLSATAAARGKSVAQPHVVKAVAYNPSERYKERPASTPSNERPTTRTLSPAASSSVEAERETESVFYARPVLVVATQDEEEDGEEDEESKAYAPLTPPLSAGEGEQLSPLAVSSANFKSSSLSEQVAGKLSKLQLERALSHVIAGKQVSKVSTRHSSTSELSIETASPLDSTSPMIQASPASSVEFHVSNIQSLEEPGVDPANRFSSDLQPSTPTVKPKPFSPSSSTEYLKYKKQDVGPRPFGTDPKKFRRLSLDPKMLDYRQASTLVSESSKPEKQYFSKRKSFSSDNPVSTQSWTQRQSALEQKNNDLHPKTTPGNRMQHDSKLRAQYAPRRLSETAVTSARYQDSKSNEIQYKGYVNPENQSKTFQKLRLFLREGDDSSIDNDFPVAQKNIASRYNDSSSLYGTSTGNSITRAETRSNINPSTLAMIQEIDAEKKLPK